MDNSNFSQKKLADSNNKDADKTSATESLIGVLNEDDLDARKAERLEEKYRTM